MKVEQKVKEILVDQLGCNEEEVTDEAKIVEDLGADSLDFVELSMTFEDEFSIELEEEKIAKLGTVQALVEHIKNLKS